MNCTNKPRALVIGGSLGGLFAATTLRAIGWEVDVFERSPHEIDSRGGGVVLQPDVLAAFRAAGIPHNGSLGVRSGDRIYLNRDGKVIRRHFSPQTQTSWNMLYGAMKRGLPAEHLHPGEQFARFEQEGDKIHAHFCSGRVETGDLLIGADGARSTVRQQLMPGRCPTYAGYVAWRGLVDELDLPESAASVLSQTFAFQQGQGHLMLEYMIPGEDESQQVGHRRWNWVWYRKVAAGLDIASLLTDRKGVRHALSLPPGSAKDADITDLRQTSSDLLAPSFQQLVGATKEPFVQAILDLQVRRMAYGRAVLIGDAAFVPRPHTAGSTAKAAANALTLAQALRYGNSIDGAIANWEASQLEAGLNMTEWGMKMGDQIMGLSRTTAVLT